MSDNEWQKINSALCMPDEARRKVEHAIGLFRCLVRADAVQSPWQSREKVQGALNATTRLCECLDALDSAGIDVMAKSPPGNSGLFYPSPLQELERLSDLFSGVKELESRLRVAVDRFEQKATRSRGNLDLLVGCLDMIVQKHANMRIMRSKKSPTWRFVDDVVSIASPDIGPGSVDEAMKAVIKNRTTAVRGEINRPGQV